MEWLVGLLILSHGLLWLRVGVVSHRVKWLENPPNIARPDPPQERYRR